ncbi:hypothetical protein ACROYT_G038941 [Oculina patagonica]
MEEHRIEVLVCVEDTLSKAPEGTYSSSTTEKEEEADKADQTNHCQLEQRDQKIPKTKKRALGLSYLIDENPPWYICLLLGLQHYLTMLGSTLVIPFILSRPMCFENDPLVISEVLSTIFVVSGIATLLQTTFGVRSWELD